MEEAVRVEDSVRICPRFHKAIELVGKRWTGSIIQALMEGPRRFVEMRGAVAGLHDRLLSERLKELETAGLVQRRVYAEMPVRIEYELTEKGRDLQRVVTEVHKWADRWISVPAKAAAAGKAARRSRR